MSNKYTKHIIISKGFPVRVYVNEDNSQALLIFPFGRYLKVSSDTDVLDFAIDFLVSKSLNNVISFAAYKSSQEDTDSINIAA